MTNIALPIWLLTLMVATPSLCLLVLTIRAGKRDRIEKRSHSAEPVHHLGYNPLMDPSFQHDLHALQIDAVFNAMSALIETERIKLKSLLCPVLSQIPAVEVDDQIDNGPLPDRVEEKEMDICHQIIERTAQGESAGDIANSLGISRSEIDLAISMNQEIGNNTKCRLEAVA